MLGDFAVGKTSLVRRFVEGSFDDRYLTTIGVKVTRRAVEIPDFQKINLLIWDLAGGEEYSEIQTSYLQGSSGALLVCDLTRINTLAAIEPYAQRLNDINPQAKLILAGNKDNLVEEREIPEENFVELAASLDAQWFITSAKTGNGVENAFNSLAKSFLKQS